MNVQLHRPLHKVAACWLLLCLALPSVRLIAAPMAGDLAAKCCKTKGHSCCQKHHAASGPQWNSSASSCHGQCAIPAALSAPTTPVIMSGVAIRLPALLATRISRVSRRVQSASPVVSYLYQRPPPSSST
ncbi:MAG: hypothetical protein M3Y07_16725 [Acidobacteriota bacterium]|nr:hypothetical protein [Acidobacteriota bacterium]